MRINFKGKKLDKDRHRTKHKVFMWHYRPKTLRSKDTEISTQPSFEAFCKTKGWKGSCLTFFGSETEKKWVQFVLIYFFLKKTRFDREILLPELCRSLNWKTHKWKMSVFRNSVFFLSILIVPFFSLFFLRFRQLQEIFYGCGQEKSLDYFVLGDFFTNQPLWVLLGLVKYHELEKLAFTVRY